MEHSHDATIALAQAIGKVTFGDWGATGYEIKAVLVMAAEEALMILDRAGYDMTMLDAAKPNDSRCACGHVKWAHWPTGQCAHCDCTNVELMAKYIGN